MTWSEVKVRRSAKLITSELFNMAIQIRTWFTSPWFEQAIARSKHSILVGNYQCVITAKTPKKMISYRVNLNWITKQSDFIISDLKLFQLLGLHVDKIIQLSVSIWLDDSRRCDYVQANCSSLEIIREESRTLHSQVWYHCTQWVISLLQINLLF